MNDTLQCIYTLMWFAASAAVFYNKKKHRLGFYINIVGAMLAFLGCWWLLNLLVTDADLLSGVYGWVFRGIVIAFIALFFIFYFRERKK